MIDPSGQLPGQLPGQLQQRDLEVLERRNVALPGDQYQVESLGQITLLQPKGLTQQSLQPTATNRIAVFLRNTQPEPRSTTLATDIGEEADLSSKRPDLAMKLRESLDAWLKDVSAEMPKAR